MNRTKDRDKNYFKTPVFRVKNEQSQFKSSPSGRLPKEGYPSGRLPKEGYPSGRLPKEGYPSGRLPKEGYPSNQTPGFLNIIKEGLGIGLGVNIANQVIGRSFDYLFGPRSIVVKKENEGDKGDICNHFYEIFEECRKKDENDCNKLFEEWHSCKTNNK